MSAIDVTPYRKGSQWGGTFKLTDSCVGFFLIIKNELGTIDANDGKGYVFPLKDVQNHILSGGSASFAHMFLETYSSYRINYDQEQASTLLKNEFQAYPELKPIFLSAYLKTIDFTDSGAKRRLAQEADSIYRNRSAYEAETLHALAEIYQKLGQRKKSEKCMNSLLKEFPRSRFAFQWRSRPYQEAFFRAKTLKERVKIHKEMIQVMKEQIDPQRDLLDAILDRELKTSSKPSELSSTVLDNELYSLSIQGLQLSKLLLENYWKEGELSDWFALVNSSPYYFHKTYLYNTFVKQCIAQDTLLEKAHKVISEAVSMSRQHLDAPRTLREQAFTHLAHSEVILSRSKSLAENLVTQAQVLAKQNKTKEALDAYREAIEINNQLDSEINEQFVSFLIDNKMFNEAKEEVEQAIRVGKYTLEMEQMLANLPDDRPLVGDNISSHELKENYLAEKRRVIAAMLQSTPAPDFNLVSLEGDTVQLSNLRGKVVILDFWTSWCIPCIMSFPGMQKAVEKYRDNSSVVFLFINLDKKDALEKVRKNINQNGYNFTVLLDPGNQTGPAYSIHGIPLKFVIDREGIIRFRKGSFEPNIKDEIEELSIMIDLAQEQSVSNQD